MRISITTFDLGANDPAYLLNLFFAENVRRPDNLDTLCHGDCINKVFFCLGFIPNLRNARISSIIILSISQHFVKPLNANR